MYVGIGCLEKSLPKKSEMKSAVFGAPVSFLHELIARLGEVSGFHSNRLTLLALAEL